MQSSHSGVDLERVAPDPEPAPSQHHVVALVVHVDEPTQGGTVVYLEADLQDQQLALVVLR